MIQHPSSKTNQTSASFAQAPTTVELLSLGARQDLQNNLHKWTVEASDCLGCFSLTNPAIVKPHVALEDPECPIVTLLAELRNRGWVAVRHLVRHVPGVGGPKLASIQNASSKRDYFQCLLSWDRCVASVPPGRADLEMPSNQCGAYYKLQKFQPWFAPPGFPATAYTDWLARLQRGEQVEPPSVDDIPLGGQRGQLLADHIVVDAQEGGVGGGALAPEADTDEDQGGAEEDSPALAIRCRMCFVHGGCASLGILLCALEM